jgi:uncharacterized membrane protein YccC
MRLPRQAVRVRQAVAPDWLIEVVRPRPAPVPWAAMVRAALAICVPLAAGLAAHEVALGLLPAIGGLIAVSVDLGGPYWARAKRVGSATVFGGAVGLTIGTLIHGRGWVAVIALVLVAGFSVVLTELGSIGSVTGMQMLVSASFGFGPLGALRPWWTGPLEFLIGVAWAMILILPGWLLAPQSAEQHAVADVYRALAARLRAVGTSGYVASRRALTGALNAAYDQLITTRTLSGGVNRRLMALIALLNHAHLVTEATTAVAVAGDKPPPAVADAIDELADSILYRTPPPAIPPPWDDTPGARALHDALTGAVRLLSGQQVAPPPGLDGPPGRPGQARPRLWQRLDRAMDQVRGGRLIRTFALRLMASIGLAAVVSEVLPLQRSYWVVLTVAIVLKPDLGSVFARALQRGIGTIVGAVIGAIILAIVPYGLWLLIPFAVLAALLPYGRSRNYGLFSTLQTPLVVLLIDLLDRTGWRLAEARLLDTLIGCAIALVVGYALWPSSYQAHLPDRFADAVEKVSAYTERALVKHAPDRLRLRRQTYRDLSDVRTEFQRTMSEPPAMSRRAAAWWPAVVGLEQVMDAVTAASVSIDMGAPAPPVAAVRQITAVLDQIAGSVRSGIRLTGEAKLPSDEALSPVTDAVRGVRAVVA